MSGIDLGEHLGAYLGRVIDVKDPLKSGRVRVNVPGLVEASSWARAVFLGAGHHSLAGKSTGTKEVAVGSFAVPPENSLVLVMFVQGWIDEPVYIGGMFPVEPGRLPGRKWAIDDPTIDAHPPFGLAQDQQSGYYGDPQDHVILASRDFQIHFDDKARHLMISTNPDSVNPAEDPNVPGMPVMIMLDLLTNSVTINGANEVNLWSNGVVDIQARRVQIQGRPVIRNGRPI